MDDARDALEMIRILLTREGALVETATSGTDGLRLAEQMQFDLVLSDISMPEMDGYEFLQNLRSQPLYARTPVIATTGFGREVDVERAQKAGFTPHLTKPVNFIHLLQQVRSALNK